MRTDRAAFSASLKTARTGMDKALRLNLRAGCRVSLVGDVKVQ